MGKKPPHLGNEKIYGRVKPFYLYLVFIYLVFIRLSTRKVLVFLEFSKKRNYYFLKSKRVNGVPFPISSRFRLFKFLITYLFFVCCTKKLFEFPVERDFPNEKAFNAVQYPSLFQIFFRMRFFDVEIRFFGTAI
jgi:hypothetical protein